MEIELTKELKENLLDADNYQEIITTIDKIDTVLLQQNEIANELANTYEAQQILIQNNKDAIRRLNEEIIVAKVNSYSKDTISESATTKSILANL